MTSSTTYAQVVLGDRTGYLAVAFGYGPYYDAAGKYQHREWIEKRYPWPSGQQQLQQDMSKQCAANEQVDVFVCPAVRYTDDRRKGSALPPRVLWTDLDGLITDQTLLNELDPFTVGSGTAGHLHLYLPLTRPIDLGTHSRLNQALAARLGGDAKWSDESLLRLPDTLNHKVDPPAPVRVLRESARVWNPDELATLLDVEQATSRKGSEKSSIKAEPAPQPLPSPVQAALDHEDTTDRSKAHHRVVCACRNAGLTAGQTLTVVSAYEPSLAKYGARLAGEVARSWTAATPSSVSADEATPRKGTGPFSRAGGDRVTDFSPDLIRPETDDGPLTATPFPALDPAALQGTAGKIVNAVLPHTEAHPAPILAQLLAHFGATIGRDPHVWVDNQRHSARIYPLIVGKTSEGAKGTSDAVVTALFAAAQRHRPDILPLLRTSGLSSGEGVIEALRDARGAPGDKGYDEGVTDKRILVVEPEFTSLLAVMERQNSIMPRVAREAWDGDTLRTLTRTPLIATGAHVVIVGHVTPGELRIRLKEAQLVGGTMNRFVPVASRRTKLCPDGGNLPEETLEECGALLADALDRAAPLARIRRTDTAGRLWHAHYAALRKARPDGPVASILARAAPQVLRLSLTYALTDGCRVIDEQHLAAALALWSYIEATAEWMFGAEVDTGEIDTLVAYIAAGGDAGRTRTEISSEHFQRNRPSPEIKIMLGQLMTDGRIRQVTDRSAPGAPVTRYYA